MILVFLVIGGMLFHANSCHHNSYDYDCTATAMIATTVVASGCLVVLQEPHHGQHHSFCSMWW